MSTVGAPGAPTQPNNVYLPSEQLNPEVTRVVTNTSDTVSISDSGAVDIRDALLSDASSIYKKVNKLFSKIKDEDIVGYGQLFEKPTKDREIKLSLVNLATGQTVKDENIKILKTALEAELKSDVKPEDKKLLKLAAKVLMDEVSNLTDSQAVIDRLIKTGEASKKTIIPARKDLFGEEFFKNGSSPYTLQSYLKGLYSGDKEQDLNKLFNSDTATRKAVTALSQGSPSEQKTFPSIKAIIGNDSSIVDALNTFTGSTGELQQGEWETLAVTLNNQMKEAAKKIPQDLPLNKFLETAESKDFKLAYAKYLLVVKAQSVEDYLVNVNYEKDKELNGVTITKDDYPLKKDNGFKILSEATKQIEDEYGKEMDAIQDKAENDPRYREINNIFKQIYNQDIPVDPLRAIQVELTVKILDDAVNTTIATRVQNAARNGTVKGFSEPDRQAALITQIRAGGDRITKNLKDGLAAKAEQANGIFTAAIQGITNSAITSGGGGR
jgi:hypothetical protein